MTAIDRRTLSGLRRHADLLVSGLALLFASHAWSTVPNCSVVALLTNFPQPGQFVPQNAQIRIQGLSTAVLPDGLEVLVDDVSVDYDRVNHNYDPAGLYTMTVLTPVEPFPAFADVRVAHISTGQTVLEFTVDEGLDTTPPEWDGSLAIREQYRSGKWIPCNDVYLHGFFLENVTDDLTEDLGFFVTAVPDVGDMGFAGPLVGEISDRPGCPGSDLSLKDTFRRTYTFQVFDGAGNATEEFEIKFGKSKGCGCLSGTVPTLGWLLGPLLLLVPLRQRRSGDRPSWHPQIFTVPE